MKKALKYILLIFSFLIVFLHDIIAQDSLKILAKKHSLVPPTFEWSLQKQQRYHAALSVFELKTGALVVALPTNAKRIHTLEVLSRSKEISEAERLNVRASMENIAAETAQKQTELLQSFANLYLFSKLYFIHDTSIVRLQQGFYENILLNKEGNSDPSIVFDKNEPFFFCIFKIVDISKETEGLVLHDVRLKQVLPPFPAATVAKSSGWNSLLELITRDKKYGQIAMDKNVRLLQQRLDDFYGRVTTEFKALESEN
jgi:hypothetical protein